MRRRINQLSKYLSFPTFLVVCIIGTSCKKDEPVYFQGYLEADYIYISSETGGTLEELAVTKGDWVEKDILLFKLDATPLKALRDQARAQLRQARAQTADLEQPSRPSEISAQDAVVAQQQAVTELSAIVSKRQYELMQDGATPEEDYDQAQYTHQQNQAALLQTEAQLATAHLGSRTNQILAAHHNETAMKEALEHAEWQLKQTQKAVPTYSFVYDTLYRVGEYVPAGNPVVILLPPENIKLRFFVTQRVVDNLKMGQNINFTNAGGPLIPARINYISSNPEYTPPVIFSRETSAKLVFMIEAVIDIEIAKKLHPGQPVEVHL